MPKPWEFVITNEQLASIELPQGNIGINDFANAVNEVIHLSLSKKLSSAIVFKKLKELGILSESSASYGIESATRFFNGRLYTQVVFNETGKEFLLHNLRKLVE